MAKIAVQEMLESFAFEQLPHHLHLVEHQPARGYSKHILNNTSVKFTRYLNFPIFKYSELQLTDEPFPSPGYEKSTREIWALICWNLPYKYWFFQWDNQLISYITKFKIFYLFFFHLELIRENRNTFSSFVKSYSHIMIVPSNIISTYFKKVQLPTHHWWLKLW